MTDYNDGNWHGWNGGECPVHPKTLVEYIYHKEDLGIVRTEKRAAGGGTHINPVPWRYVVKFRVIQEHKECTGPQEVWLRECETLYGMPDGFYQCEKTDEGARLFREVMDE